MVVVGTDMNAHWAMSAKKARGFVSVVGVVGVVAILFL